MPVRKCACSPIAAQDQHLLDSKLGHLVMSEIRPVKFLRVWSLPGCSFAKKQLVMLVLKHRVNALTLVCTELGANWKQFEREHFKKTWRPFVFQVASGMEMPLVLTHGKSPASFTLLPSWVYISHHLVCGFPLGCRKTHLKNGCPLKLPLFSLLLGLLIFIKCQFLELLRLVLTYYPLPCWQQRETKNSMLPQLNLSTGSEGLKHSPLLQFSDPACHHK